MNDIYDLIINKPKKQKLYIVSITSLLPLQGKITPVDDAINIIPTSNLYDIKVNSRVLIERINNTYIAIACLDKPNYYNPNRTILKTANEIVNNSTTFQNDNYLYFTLPADGNTFIIDAYFMVLSNTTANFKCSWVQSGTCTVNSSRHCWTMYGASSTTTTNTGGKGSYFGLGTTVIYPVLDTSNETVIHERFIITTSTSETVTFTLQWAQNTATVVDTQVVAGSHIQIQRTSII